MNVRSIDRPTWSCGWALLPFLGRSMRVEEKRNEKEKREEDGPGNSAEEEKKEKKKKEREDGLSPSG